MSWFPSFLNWSTALVAAGVVIPSLLLLYFLKLRRREMAVSSTLLWRKAIQDLQVNSPFQKLRRNLLLLLQMLLLLLLLLALSRPITNATRGAGKRTVILIDRSASMSATDYDGKSRLDEAKRRARELVSTMGRGVAMVIAFDDKAETIQPFTSDVNALQGAIDSIQPTDRLSRLKVAYQLAEAQSFYVPEQLRENAPKPDVFLYSDGRVLDGNELSLFGQLTYEPLGKADSANIAIVALSAKRNYERPNEVQVFARLANYGPTPVNADVELRIDNGSPIIATTTLAPERWSEAERNTAEKQSGLIARDSIEFPPIDLTTSAVIKIEQMNKADDVLAADDAARVIVPPPKNLEVLLVTNGNPFLERALDSLNLQKPARMPPGTYEQQPPTNYDVIIFDRYSPKTLPPAGSFIYFGAAPPDLKLKAVKEDNRNVLLREIEVLDWQRDHPIVRHLLMGQLYALEAIKLDVPLESEILVSGLQGPLIVLHREGRGTHLVVAFDIIESNFPLMVSFPIFMHNALQFMAVGSDMNVRQSFEPGATPNIPRAGIQKVDPTLKSILLDGPMGRQQVPIPETGDIALPALNEVGVYTLEPKIPQFEQLAVNLLDANESNILPLETAPGGMADATIGGGGKARMELWWWIIACAALPLLLIEWWVYTRRVHL